MISKQCGNVPRLVNDKPVFSKIKRSITHEALNLLLRECVATMKLAGDLEKSNQSYPSIVRNRFRADNLLPIEFGLPCQRFLYHCLMEQKAILMSLIHPKAGIRRA